MRKPSTRVHRSERLSCAVEPALAEIIRDLAERQRRTTSVFIGDLLREALAQREQSATSASETPLETTHATA
ncbi:MAG TPA: hypothetical protein VF120_10485 [Ktedonobacterales bacterium]